MEPECKESQGEFQQFIEKSGLERTDIMYDFKPMSYSRLGWLAKLESPGSSFLLLLPSFFPFSFCWEKDHG